MFGRFRVAFAGLRDDPSTSPAWQDSGFAAVQGYEEFMAEFAGASFGGGLYRVHDARTGPEGRALIADSFPDFAARVSPFGYDWLGRQFAVDSGRLVGGEPQALLLEPGTGEALEIPATFSAFHDEELVDFSDAALAEDFFRDWSAKEGRFLPLRRDQCAGYVVPLFLGGQDDVANLEVSDLDVYWTFCGQLRHGLRHVAGGSPVTRVERGKQS